MGYGVVSRRDQHNKGGTDCSKIFKNKVIHFPRLDTVIMVEETIRKYGPVTKTELSRKLRKKVMWPTLTLILDYFKTMRFIVITGKGKIVWIYNPELVKKYANRDDLEWKPK